MKIIKNYNCLKVAIFIISVIFSVPSLVYLFINKTVLNFDGSLEYCFLLTNNIDRLYQAGIYALLITIYIVIYFLIIKNREKICDNIKQIYKLVIVVSLIFLCVIPFWCSDVFYYLGIGRLSSKYHQNPYYVDMKSYFDNNDVDITNDTVMQKGYNNYWSGTTVVYGAVWTMICSIISFLSFGNIDFGLLIFKLVNMMVHVGNCILLYKISKKKIFPLLYGLNPFVLIEGIGNVHNDMFVVFFMLLALYMSLKKKDIVLALLFLALATDIKYFSILLLPLVVIYNSKDKNIKERVIDCILYGGLFALFVIIPYLLYIRDLNVFLGLKEQRSRIAKGLYLVISEYFHNPENLVDIVKDLALDVFAVLYIFKCFSLLFTKKISFNKEMRNLFLFIVAFLF